MKFWAWAGVRSLMLSSSFFSVPNFSLGLSTKWLESVIMSFGYIYLFFNHLFCAFERDGTYFTSFVSVVCGFISVL